MAKYREEVCKNYVCFGVCKLGEDANYTGYCQRCTKYDPDKKHTKNKSHLNRKKLFTEKVKHNELKEYT